MPTTQYTVIPSIINRLSDIPELEDATITEEFTSPSVSRPVLNTVVSVGIKSSETVPTLRQNHNIKCVALINLCFPCGLGNQQISDTVYKVSAAFTGRTFNYMLVESVEVDNEKFNSNLYGISVNMYLHMRSTVDVTDPSYSGTVESYSIGSVRLYRFPDKVSERRARKSQTEQIENTPRIFTLTGSCSGEVAGTTWKDLQTLMGSDNTIVFSLPRDNRTVNVKPYSIETVGDTCGYGFEYKLEFIEVLSAV